MTGMTEYIIDQISQSSWEVVASPYKNPLDLSTLMQRVSERWRIPITEIPLALEREQQRDVVLSADMVGVNLHGVRLVVTPDADTPGSLGRVYFQMPNPIESYVGRKYRAVGGFQHGNRGILLISDGNAMSTVNDRGIFWWKNGVRELGLRQNHFATMYELRPDLIVLELGDPEATEHRPNLPPFQPTLF